jgi:hypothetical protein
MGRKGPMDDREFAQRAAELLEQESTEPEGWWWLSFAGEEGFRGACLVWARGFLGAVMETKLRGLNPGGEVQGVGPLHAAMDATFAEWTNRLLTRAECEEFDRVMEELYPNGPN